MVSAIRRGRRLPVLAAAILAFELGPPGMAGACMIDSTASLSANGVRASVTLAGATDLGHWAPFSVARAFATHAPVQVSESRADLARSLPATTAAAPYRWSFGDGTMLLGHAVTHRYTRPGSYKVMVYGLYGDPHGAHTWVPFDSVLLRIVPPDQVARANRAYAAQQAFGTTVTAYLWVVEGALVVVALVLSALFLRRRRAPRG